MDETPRVCATCTHFEFRQSDGPWSEYTPGTDCSFSCKRGYWAAGGGGCSESEFRSSMLAALICEDYRLVQVDPIALRVPQWKQDQIDLAELDAMMAEYPHVHFRVRKHPPFVAWYDVGHGKTTSGTHYSRRAAIDWLRAALEGLKSDAL